MLEQQVVIAAGASISTAVIGLIAAFLVARTKNGWDNRERRRVEKIKTYQEEILALAKLEQLFWHAENRHQQVKNLDLTYQAAVQDAQRSHSCTSAAVELLGDKAVIEAMGVVDAVVMRSGVIISGENLTWLKEARESLTNTMRGDIGLSSITTEMRDGIRREWNSIKYPPASA